MAEAVRQARAFALAAHADQKYGDQPYSFHLDAVAELLTSFGEEAQVIGYLHDVIEDTEVTVETLRDQFGLRVAECVALVTDETGINRRERKARTNTKLSQVNGANELALIVKAADRLANLRQSARKEQGSLMEMYKKEHTAFRLAVYRPGLCDELWREMETLITAT